MTALFVSVLIFFCSSKICTFLFYRFWLKNLKNCVQDVLKKLLPAPKLDLRRYIRKQCLLGIKKEDTERQWYSTIFYIHRHYLGIVKPKMRYWTWGFEEIFSYLIFQSTKLFFFPIISNKFAFIAKSEGNVTKGTSRDIVVCKKSTWISKFLIQKLLLSCYS